VTALLDQVHEAGRHLGRSASSPWLSSRPAAAASFRYVSAAQLLALAEDRTTVLGHPPPEALRSRHRDEVVVVAHQLGGCSADR
jgi:hypothetical protein